MSDSTCDNVCGDGICTGNDSCEVRGRISTLPSVRHRLVLILSFQERGRFGVRDGRVVVALLLHVIAFPCKRPCGPVITRVVMIAPCRHNMYVACVQHLISAPCSLLAELPSRLRGVPPAGRRWHLLLPFRSGRRGRLRRLVHHQLHHLQWVSV